MNAMILAGSPGLENTYNSFMDSLGKGTHLPFTLAVLALLFLFAVARSRRSSRT